jgi:hypothetical protein
MSKVTAFAVNLTRSITPHSSLKKRQDPCPSVLSNKLSTIRKLHLSDYKTPRLDNPRMAPAPRICPKQALPITAGKPNPPNRFDDGIAGPAFGFFIVNLANAIARILQTTMTIPTVGLHSSVLGTTASIVVSTRHSP